MTTGLDTGVADSAPQHDISGVMADLTFSNSSVTSNDIMETHNIDTEESSPESVADLYALVVQMRMDFSRALREKDETIAALSARVLTLEAGLKKKDAPNTSDNSKIVTEMKEYSSNMETMKETVAAQQKTLENLQQDRRAKNLVITGVTESTCSGKDAMIADESLVGGILAAIDCDGICPSRVARLGKKRDDAIENEVSTEHQRPPAPRPLLVSLNTATDVRAVLMKTNKLKDNENFSNVYVKRDEHPLIRQEWKRLRSIARKEKAAPINAACLIKLDYRKKAVTRDGEIIEEFVSPFRPQGPNTSA